MVKGLRLAAVAVAVFATLSRSSAVADLLAYDPFKVVEIGVPANPAAGEYTQAVEDNADNPPNDGLAGQDPVIGPTAFYGGPWVQARDGKQIVRDGSLSYPNFPVASGRVQEFWLFDCCTFGRSGRPIGDVTGAGENGIGVGRDDHLLYQSFLIDFGIVPSAPDQGFAAYEMWNGFTPELDGHPDATLAVQLAITGGGWGGSGVLELRGGGSTVPLTGALGFDDLAVQNNGVHLVVMKFDMKGTDPDTVTVYLNPTDSIESNWTPAASISYPASDLVITHHSALTQFQFPNQGDVVVETKGGAFDEIRWGQTFADVTPFVPEPGTFVLVALGLFGMIATRWR